MSLLKDPERTETKYLHQFADFALRHSFASQGGAGRRVLEIGCGDGRLTWQYAKGTKFAAGIDLNADDLRVATIERPGDLPASFVRADSVHLPFVKAKFDLAILAWSF